MREDKMLYLLNKLKSILQRDKRLVSEDGELLKNKIIELALKFDKELINLLMREKELKEHFFTEVDKIIVFDQLKFMKFVDNKEFLPDSYTTFKNKVGLTVEENYLSQNKEVVLSWSYKDCVLEGGMEKEDEKRDEVFFNEILAPDEIDRLKEPKVFTNFKRIDAKGEHKVTEIKSRDNLIIRGNNLLALCSLKKKFAGRIKLIYIDPPYNTGGDSFRYNDNFNHSTWLTFMKNRLEIARDLLDEKGFIFVQISFHEYAYLKVLLDEVFNENYVFTINLLVRHPERILKADKEFHDVMEYVLVYAKNRDKVKINKISIENDIEEYVYQIKEKSKGKPINISGKSLTVFMPNEYEIIKTRSERKNLKKISIRGALREANSSGRFYVKFLEPIESKFPPLALFKINNFGADILGYRYFYMPEKGNKNGGYFQAIPTEWKDIKERPYPNFFNFVEDYNSVVDEGNVRLRNAKKPETLIKLFTEISGTKKKEVLLDFNLGSGTTCAVAHKLGLQYIGIEQLDYGENDSVIRLKNVIGKEKSKGKLSPVIEDYDTTGISEAVNWMGGGDFIYCELMKWNDKYIDEIKKAKSSKELLNIWNLIKEKAFLSYKINPEDFDKNVKEFEQLSLENQKKFLIECLDKNQLYVNLSEIDDEDYGVLKEDKDLNKKFYGAL